MADNVNIITATGTTATIAADEVTDSVLGTVQFQLTKLVDARDGGTNRTAVDSGNNLQTAPQATVSDSLVNYLDGAQQPLSMTTQGRLRVSMVPTDMDRVWQETLNNPWNGNDGAAAWNMGDLY